ncbi:hypothetical protein LMIY3S_05440 [Labrys miyagiensis]
MAQDRAGYLRVAGKLAIFLAAFAVLEALSYLFIPPLHPLQEVSQKKPPLLQATLDSDAHYDTFFVGSSLTEEGMNPDAFAAGWGGTAFNAGLAGTANVTFAKTVIESIIEKKKPSLIVYGIEHFAFDRGVKEQDTQMFRFLNLYRQRSQIKRWLGRAVRGRFQKLPAFWDARAHVTDFDRRFRRFDGAELHPNGWVEVHAFASMVKNAESPFPGPFQEPPVQVMAIEAIKALSRKTGIPVVFVQYPQSDRALASSPQRYPGFRAFMKSHVTDDGFVFLDFNFEHPFPHENPNLYYDDSHLNSDGARTFAPLLAAEIAKRCHREDAKVVCR